MHQILNEVNKVPVPVGLSLAQLSPSLLYSTIKSEVFYVTWDSHAILYSPENNIGNQ